MCGVFVCNIVCEREQIKCIVCKIRYIPGIFLIGHDSVGYVSRYQSAKKYLRFVCCVYIYNVRTSMMR